MVEQRNIDLNKYIAVFAITTLIFILGIWVGNYFSTEKLTKLNEMEQDMKIDTMAIDIQYSLISEDPCSSIDPSILTDELYNIAQKLNYMENQLGVDNPSVQRLKEYYSLLEIQHYLFLKKTQKECNKNYTFILYFYSNKGDCPTCEEQGYTLTYIRKIYPNVRIYPFDINIENIALETIKHQYKLDKNKGLPLLVINEKSYYGFKDKNQLLPLLN